ncbi:MAG TPA: Gfo/Idh/MocA family oxidoreductase, partial [Puia sp.]|nr:Gfo/Idh/MocA family oxidoreductase [Puia sp.]
MSKTLGFAIVGCGRIAQRHAEHVQRLGKLIAVCDIDAGKAKSLAEKYGAAAFTNIDDLLKKTENIDVVSVCSPNGLHAEHTIKALRAGVHVLCEKPMALSVQDCGDMITAA